MKVLKEGKGIKCKCPSCNANWKLMSLISIHMHIQEIQSNLKDMFYVQVVANKFHLKKDYLQALGKLRSK